jgi:hypothetical protein
MVALGILAMPGRPAEPCCMVPRSFGGSIGQSLQQAILFFDQGREDLILRIHYTITGAKAMPDRFAWVVTVPHEPDAYAVADPGIFDEVDLWARRLLEPPPLREGVAVKAAAPGAPPLLEFGRAVKVGPYDIQPVRARGREALGALNAWLEKNGFPTEDPGHMAYFVDRGFTFLCMRVSPSEGEKSVAASGTLAPLHLSFKTEKMYYPLRFSSRQGVFDVQLAVFTRDYFDYDASDETLRRIAWSPADFKRNVPVLPHKFPPLLGAAYSKGGFAGEVQAWKLNLLEGSGVNQGGTIASWTDDLFFATTQAPPRPAIPFAAGAAVVAVLALVAVLRRLRKPAVS